MKTGGRYTVDSFVENYGKNVFQCHYSTKVMVAAVHRYASRFLLSSFIKLLTSSTTTLYYF
jgi:hypothetical protein